MHGTVILRDVDQHPDVTERIEAGDAPLPPADELSIVIHRDIDAVSDIWQTLEVDGLATPYQRYEFLSCWYRHIGQPEGVTPFIVLVAAAHRPIMLLPLGIQNKGPFKISSFLGGKHANFNLPIFVGGAEARLEAEHTRMVVDQIRAAAGDVDALSLSNQPVHWLGTPNPLRTLLHQPSPSNAYSVRLNTNFETFLLEKRSSRARKKLRYQNRKLTEAGGYRCARAKTPEELNRVYDAFKQQKSERFTRLGIPNVFDEPPVDAFFRDMMSNSVDSDSPTLELYWLEVDGTIRSTYGGAAWNGRFTAYFNSISEDELTRFSPGDLLLHHVIEECCHRGLHSFDLGVGEARYKASWCDETDRLFDSIIPLTARGRAYASIANATQVVKRHVKQNPALFTVFKKARAKLAR